ncbi:MAG TPA: HAD family phosphatase [archaeon]|nr:HAD family phosphatase [archaeon]
MALKAVLYDLDGLMVDSEPLHGKASEKALNAYGHTLEDIPAALRQSFYGRRVAEIAADVVNCLSLPVSPERWARERLEIFMELVEQGINLMPGAEESLSLFEGNGLKKAVVSSGDRKYVQKILRLTGLTSRFEAVVTGDDVTRGKPDPQCYLLGAQKLDVPPPGCLVLEDAYPGIKAARAAGMKVIGVENNFNSRFDGADVVVSSLAAIDQKVLGTLENRTSTN